MTGNRAGLGAQTFLLPPPAKPQMAAPEQPYNDGVQALEGLQYVKGQTADYYKKVTDLKSFMQSVQANLGIDVRVPDLSRPESIKLNQIYRDAIADIQAHGNELKQGASINNMLVSRGDIQTSSYGDQSAARAQYGKDFFNRNLEPSIMELNNKLQMPSYTKEEYDQKEAARQDAVKYWENVRDTQPDKKEYAEYQLRGISPTTQGQWRPQSTYQDRNWGRKVQAAGNWLKKTTNLILGADDSYKPNNKVLNEDGSGYVLSSFEFANQKIGDATVVRFDRDPEANDGAGKTSMIVRRGDGSLGAIDITNQDAQALVTQLSRGLDPAALVEYTEKNQLQDDYQRLDMTKASGGDVDKRRAAIETPLKDINNKEFQAAKVAVMRDLSALKTPTGISSWWSNPEEKFFGPLKISRVKDGDTYKFQITNINELIEGESNPKKQKALRDASKFFEDTNEGRVELFTLMAKLGVFKDYLSKGDNTEQPQEITTPGTNSADKDPLGILQ